MSTIKTTYLKTAIREDKLLSEQYRDSAHKLLMSIQQRAATEMNGKPDYFRKYLKQIGVSHEELYTLKEVVYGS